MRLHAQPIMLIQIEHMKVDMLINVGWTSLVDIGAIFEDILF